MEMLNFNSHSCQEKNSHILEKLDYLKTKSCHLNERYGLVFGGGGES